MPQYTSIQERENYLSTPPLRTKQDKGFHVGNVGKGGQGEVFLSGHSVKFVALKLC